MYLEAFNPLAVRSLTQDATTWAIRFLPTHLVHHMSVRKGALWSVAYVAV